MKINLEKLNYYLKNGEILEFESDEECLDYFNIYDHQSFKTVDELRRYQGKYGFSIGKRRYHINTVGALDIREDFFLDTELDILHDGVMTLIRNNNQAIRLTRDEKAKDALHDTNRKYRELMKKISNMQEG